MKILLEPYTFFMEELEQSGKDFVVNILASVTQFPIKLAYAITIHKSQGMSIEKLVCDIDHIFKMDSFMSLFLALQTQIL